MPTRDEGRLWTRTNFIFLDVNAKILHASSLTKDVSELVDIRKRHKQEEQGRDEEDLDGPLFS